MALTHMQENFLVRACVYATTLGQFLMAPVKSVDVANGKALGSTFHETEKIIVYCTKFLLTKTCQRKEDSTPTE